MCVDRRHQPRARTVVAPWPVVRVLTVGLATVAAGCVERTSPTQARSTGPSRDAGRTGAPAAIGRAPDEIPQVRLPQPPQAPRPFTTTAPLRAPASFASLPAGGAVLVWPVMVTEHPPLAAIVSQLFDRDGVGGAISLLHRGRGNVRGLSVAARANDLMMAANVEYGGYGSSVGTVRFRSDGTVLGRPNVVGSFRVAATQGDAATLSDALGFPSEIVATADRFAVGLRGPLSDCAGTPCSTVRVAEVDDGNDVRGRAGIEHVRPAAPVALLGPVGAPWSAAVTVIDGERPTIRIMGTGALSRLGAVEGRSLVAAFQLGESGYMIVRAGVPSTAPANAVNVPYDLIAPRAGGTGANAPAAIRTDGVRTSCVAGVPSVVLTAGAQTVSVPITAPGGPSVMTWALSRPRRGATYSAIASGWTGSVLLVAREGHVDLMRCEGASLVIGAAQAAPAVAAAADAAPSTGARPAAGGP